MTFYIYNPLSKNKTGIKSIETYQLENLYDCTNEQQMQKLAHNLKEQDTIYLIGGDGTLHYLLNNYNYLFNHSIKFFKNGSGNDFNRALKGNKSYYYTINEKYNFINSFGLGFDALVCEKVNKLSNKTKLSYFKECYRSLSEYQPFSLDVFYDDNWHHFDRVWLCSLQNGNYFGGGIKIAKNAQVDQEKLDLCIGHNLNRFTVLLLLLFVKLGILHWFKKIFFTRKIDNLTIKNNRSILCQFDGDTFYLAKDIVLTNYKVIDIEKVSEL